MSVTPTAAAAAVCSMRRVRAISVRLMLRSDPPASPSVMMQYDTARPSDVHLAVLPAQPKSQSSGCATTIRMLWAVSAFSATIPMVVEPHQTPAPGAGDA